jgi:hypothetical protein
VAPFTQKEAEQIKHALIKTRDEELSKVSSIPDKEKARNYKNQIMATFTVLLRKVTKNTEDN